MGECYAVGPFDTGVVRYYPVGGGTADLSPSGNSQFVCSTATPVYIGSGTSPVIGGCFTSCTNNSQCVDCNA
jgi:hypothetical protein